MALAQGDVEPEVDKVVVVIEGKLTVVMAEVVVEMEVEVSRLAEPNFNRGNVRAGTHARQAQTHKNYLRRNTSMLCKSLMIHITYNYFVQSTSSHEFCRIEARRSFKRSCLRTFRLVCACACRMLTNSEYEAAF